eukprot:GHVR01172589.1.p1 GENE.GHVR01172589.1~~GHVR01172589.1.p1  ORF type:complete len:180 (-),score=48.11 GHVR01172589.1:302-841(-)
MDYLNKICVCVCKFEPSSAITVISEGVLSLISQLHQLSAPAFVLPSVVSQMCSKLLQEVAMLHCDFDYCRRNIFVFGTAGDTEDCDALCVALTEVLHSLVPISDAVRDAYIANLSIDEKDKSHVAHTHMDTQMPTEDTNTNTNTDTNTDTDTSAREAYVRDRVNSYKASVTAKIASYNC